MTQRSRAALTAIVVGLSILLAGTKGCELPIIAPDAPISEPGLHVLILEETSDRSKLPAGQLDVLTSTKIRQAVDEAEGRLLILDVSSDLSLLDQLWQEAAAREHGDLPWWIVSNGKTGVEQPLPSSVEEALSTIQAHAPDQE